MLGEYAATITSQVEVTERLLDRLEDCKSAFPVAAVLGGANDAVLSRLRGGRAGVQEVLFVDSSRAMLERMQRQQQQQVRWIAVNAEQCCILQLMQWDCVHLKLK